MCKKFLRASGLTLCLMVCLSCSGWAVTFINEQDTALYVRIKIYMTYHDLYGSPHRAIVEMKKLDIILGPNMTKETMPNSNEFYQLKTSFYKKVDDAENERLKDTWKPQLVPLYTLMITYNKNEFSDIGEGDIHIDNAAGQRMTNIMNKTFKIPKTGGILLLQ